MSFFNVKISRKPAKTSDAGNYNTRKRNCMSARCHRIKTSLLFHSACHKTYADYFWKNFSSHWNWTKKMFTPMGSCVQLQISADLRSNLVFTKFKRKVLTCLQTKNLKRLLIVTTTHSMSNKLSCRQPATRCCVTIITKLKCDTLVWKKYPKKHLKRDGQMRAVFFFLLRCGYRYQHFSFRTVS